MSVARKRMSDAYDELEARIIANAAYCTSVIFIGRGVYDRREYPALDAARAGAKGHAGEKGKPAMIYAVDQHGRQAFVAAVAPERRNG
jgi:hypothetical protein